MKIEKITLYLILMCGIVLSLIQYFFNRSLWLDEAMLAVNIIDKKFLELLNPLEFNQVAPILFLFIEKTFSRLIPNSELGLRLFPLICYYISLFSFYKLVKINYSNFFTRVFTLSIFVFSSTLIYYSSELKQYISDLAVLCLTFYILLRKYEKPKIKYYLLGLVGIISIFLSNVAVIILFSTGIYWLIADWKTLNLKSLILVFTFWGISFITYYIFFIKDHPTKEMMLSYWSNRNAFLPSNPFSIEFYIFLRDKFLVILSILSNDFKAIDNIFEFSPSKYFNFLNYTYGGLLTIGYIGLIRNSNKNKLIILYLFPLIVHLTLSLFKIYPFDLRLVLYQIPILFIVIGNGINIVVDRILVKLNNSIKIITLLIPAVFLISFLSNPFPIEREEARIPLKFIEENASETDNLYLYHGSHVVFQYYRRINFTRPNLYVEYGKDNKYNVEEYINEIENLGGQCWLIFGHPYIGEVEYIITQLDKKGHIRLKEIHAGLSSAYLYSIEK